MLCQQGGFPVSGSGQHGSPVLRRIPVGGCYRNGFSVLIPLFSKSGVFLVTMMSEWRLAVAAIWLSREGMVTPDLSHFALS